MQQTNDLHALQTLCSDLSEIEDEIATLSAQRETIRAQIGAIVAQLGGKTMLPGYGRLEITAPAVIVSYDRGQIDTLLTELKQSHPELATRLVACRREAARSGGLRIIRERRESRAHS